MKKPKQKPKCKRIISRLKTNPKDWFMYVCTKCGNWYDEVDYLAPYHNDWCLTVDGEVLTVFASRSAARRFLLWKGQKHERAK